MSFAFKKLETFAEVQTTVEMTSLEEAYLNIIKKNEPHQLGLSTYDTTSCEAQVSWQLSGILKRRLTVFWREPRQWFMTLSPFINVMIIFLVFFSLFSVKFKNGVADDI